jgi:hypothetical protein
MAELLADCNLIGKDNCFSSLAFLNQQLIQLPSLAEYYTLAAIDCTHQLERGKGY